MAVSRNSDNGSEMFPIVDEEGNIIGSATRAQCHGGSMLLHPVVHLHVYDTLGRIYLQRRPEWKDIQPGKWDTAVGGHIDLGETPLEALSREASEEIGLSGFKPEMIARYVFESDREKELVHVWKTVTDSTLTPSEELAGGRFWTSEEVARNLGKNVFTPNFESEYRRFLDR